MKTTWQLSLQALLGALLLLIVLTSGCLFSFERSAEVQVGEVKGRVVDDAGDAVPFARITIENSFLSARSTSDGTFLVKGLDAGIHRLRVVVDTDANGFPSAGAIVGFSFPPNTGILLGDVVVQGTATLTGSVAFEDGAPAAGARVSVFREFDLDGNVYDGPIEVEVTTDTDGSFVVPGIVPGPFRIFAEGETVGNAQTLSTDTPDNLRLILPDVGGAQLSPEVVLVVSPAPSADVQIFLRKNLGGDVQAFTRAFAAGEVVLDGLTAGRYDVRVCSRGDACSVASNSDAMAFAMPLPPTGAQYRWGPLVFSECLDCDSDGVDRFLTIDAQTLEACGETCARVYDDPAATCETDGDVRDCDDDGDGQPDIFEPADCRLPGQGGDRDNDGLCDRDDPFPDCPANVGALCNVPGAFPVGEAALPGQGPVATPNVDECALEISDCDVNADCADLEDGFLCTCRAGFEGDGSQCSDVDECATPDFCGPAGLCVNAPGGFSCSCDSGNVVGDDGRCENADECVATPDICGSGVCTDSDGAYTCACDPGYTFDDVSCADVDECALTADVCGPTGTCTNAPGGFSCACGAGYAVNGSGICENVDECADTPTVCGQGACVDEEGAYGCTCDLGFSFDGVTCVDVDECADIVNPVCGTGSATCTNLTGSFDCSCETGFEFLTDDCVDVDECSAAPCADTVEACINSPGTFLCVCAAGFTDDGAGTCIDRDECVETPDVCDSNAVCTNVFGSVDCDCNRGFAGDGFTCAVDNAVAFCTPAALPAETYGNELVEFDFGGDDNDRHGRAVAISDNGLFMVVGAPNALNGSPSTGAAYVYQNNGTSWDRIAKEFPVDAVDLDDVGFSVAINSDGTRFAFGGPANDAAGNSSGTVWVYSRTGPIVTFEQRLTATNASPGANFGETLAMSATGDVLAVGAPGAPGTGAGSGAVYLYFGNPYANESIVSDGVDATADFGEVVALDALGDRLVVGARSDSSGAGAAFTFVRNGAVWDFETELPSPEPTTGVFFGDGVAISPDASTIVVGARRDDSLVDRGGAAYVYERVGGVWTYVQKLRANTTVAVDEFGGSVAVGSGGVPLVIGTEGTPNLGKVVLYAVENNAYCEQQTLTGTLAGEQFGYAVDVTPSGSNLVVGERFGNAKALVGKVHTYEAIP